MPSNTLLTFIVLLLTALTYLLSKLWNARRIFTKFQHLALPMPPHSLIAGHLQTLASMMPSFPGDAIKVYLFGAITAKYSQTGACYLDLWPFAAPFLIITSPYLANQVSAKPEIALEKPDALRTWFWSITGGISIFDAPAKEWKGLRSLFARAFSEKHLMALVPAMVEETEVYCQVLREKAVKGEMFTLDPVNLRLMLDVIGRTGLNVKLGCQRGPNPLADALLSQISWKISNQELNPLQWLNMARFIMERINSRKMNHYIDTEVTKRFLAYKSNAFSQGTENFESIIDIALQDYFAGRSADKQVLDKEFRTLAQRNMRMLLFSGHDSTASTITYAYYLLSLNPSCLARLRAEHDVLLGTDLSCAAALISANPSILNKLVYTHAVIKETLRLFPPAASIRQGSANGDLIDEAGKHFPTENCMVYILHLSMHRSPANFPRAEEFLPERWLVDSDHELYGMRTKGAWRPFEHGPRNCIAQTAVWLGIKVVLALTVREFEIRDAYEEFDSLKRQPKGKGVKEVNGERAYQLDEGAAHPADHFPCRVSLRGAVEGKGR